MRYRPVRRFFLCLAAVSLLIVVPAASAAPPHPVNVTTPMTRDLDANGYSIRNVGNLNAAGNITAQSNIETTGYVVAPRLVTLDGVVLFQPLGVAVIAIASGRAAPTATCPTVNPGSLYLQGAPSPALWMNTGPCDWQRITP